MICEIIKNYYKIWFTGNKSYSTYRIRVGNNNLFPRYGRSVEWHKEEYFPLEESYMEIMMVLNDPEKDPPVFMEILESQEGLDVHICPFKSSDFQLQSFVDPMKRYKEKEDGVYLGMSILVRVTRSNIDSFFRALECLRKEGYKTFWYCNERNIIVK